MASPKEIKSNPQDCESRRPSLRLEASSVCLTPSLGAKPKIFSPALKPVQPVRLLKTDLESLETIKKICNDAFTQSNSDEMYDQQAIII